MPKLNDLSNKSLEAMDKIIFDDKSAKVDYGKPPEYAALKRNAARYREEDKPGCFADIVSCLFL